MNSIEPSEYDTLSSGDDDAAEASDDWTEARLAQIADKQAVIDAMGERHAKSHCKFDRALADVIRGMTRLAERMTALEQEHVTMARIAHAHDGQTVKRPPMPTKNIN